MSTDDELKILAVYPDNLDYEIFYYQKLMKDGTFFENNIFCAGLVSHPKYVELKGVVLFWMSKFYLVLTAIF